MRVVQIRKGIYGLIALVAILSFPIVASAADRGEVLRIRGESAAAAGRCEEAVSLLGQARAANPQDARAALVAGQCQITLGDYSAAISSLQDAARLAPSAETSLYLGIAKYHLEDIDGASAELEKALAGLPDRAEVHLYVGLIALQRGEATSAAASLQRASRTNPDAVEPIASFYEGMARESQGERRTAEAALRRARDLGRGTVWEQQAETALARLEVGDTPSWKASSGRELEILDERSASWWLTATVGFEYDSNVILRGEDVQRPEEIGSDGDERGAYWAEAGWEIFANEDWTVGVLASYYGTAHDDLEDFDIHYPGVSVWVDRRLATNTIGRIQYDFGYAFNGDAWVGDSNEFLRAHTWTPAIYQDWGKAGSTRVFARIGLRNYLFDNDEVVDGLGPAGSPCPMGVALCSPPGVNEDRDRNRDGVWIETGFDHSISLFNDQTVLRTGYHFHNYDSRGSEYNYQAHEALVGARQLLPGDFVFEVYGGYTWRPYRNRSTFPDPGRLVGGEVYPLGTNDRYDESGRVDVSFERPVNDYIWLSSRYSYINNTSNVDVFDFDRHLIGVYATVRIGP